MNPVKADSPARGQNYGERVLICLRQITQAVSLHARSLVKQVGLIVPQLFF